MQSIILSRRDIREYDQMITLYTRELGKIDVLARGVKKVLSKNSAFLEPFCFVEAEVIPGKDFAHLGSVVPIDIFKHIRNDLFASLSASYVMNVLNSHIPTGDPDKRIFDMLCSWLTWLNDGMTNKKFIHIHGVASAVTVFMVKFLALLGFNPASADTIHRQSLHILLRSSWHSVDIIDIDNDELTRLQRVLYQFATTHFERKISDWSIF